MYGQSRTELKAFNFTVRVQSLWPHKNSRSVRIAQSAKCTLQWLAIWRTAGIVLLSQGVPSIVFTMVGADDTELCICLCGREILCLVPGEERRWSVRKFCPWYPWCNGRRHALTFLSGITFSSARDSISILQWFVSC